MKREMTAKEHCDMLEKDPKYQAMMAEKEHKWAEMKAMLDGDEKQLVEALNATGGNVKCVWDLVNSAESYPHLLDTLAEHLTHPYHSRIREGIARALTVKEARGTHVPGIVMAELKKLTDPKDVFENSYRWSLVNALVIIGDKSLMEEVRKLLEDPRYSTVRVDLKRLARALSSEKSSRIK
jgi:hypothetical protein